VQNEKNYQCATCNATGFYGSGFHVCAACNGTGKQQLPDSNSKLPLAEQFRITHVFKRLDVMELRAVLYAMGLENAANASNEGVLSVAHTVRLKLFNSTQEEKDVSETWLRQRGYTIPKV